MIVSWDYFSQTYLGQGVSAEDFPRLNLRSQDLIDAYTRGQLSGFENFDESTQTYVKKAICAQIEYYNLYTTEVGFAEEDKGFTVGKVSVGGGSSDSQSKNYISPIAKSYLELAGLMGRQVGVRC